MFQFRLPKGLMPQLRLFCPTRSRSVQWSKVQVSCQHPGHFRAPTPTTVFQNSKYGRQNMSFFHQVSQKTNSIAQYVRPNTSPRPPIPSSTDQKHASKPRRNAPRPRHVLLSRWRIPRLQWGFACEGGRASAAQVHRVISVDDRQWDDI